MPTPLTLEQQIDAEPEDTFVFQAKPGWLGTQYHIQVDGANPGIIIGVWGPNNPRLGKARSQPGKAYVNRTLSKGSWVITVKNAEQPYQIVVTKNSWFKKAFGSESAIIDNE